MDSGDGSVTANSIADIQAYLSNFQKDIQGPQTVSINGQHFIIQPAPIQPVTNDTDVPEDNKNTLRTSLDAVEAQDPNSIENEQLNGTFESTQKHLLPLVNSSVMNNDNSLPSALETIMPQTSVVSSSISQNTQVQTVDTTDGTQLMALTPQLITGPPILTPSSVSATGTESQTMMVTTSAPDGSIVNSDGTLTGGTDTSYQTVTIMPSGDVTQTGEMSYVLIVSQPDGTQEGKVENQIPSSDLSVYDFKEEKGGALSGCELDEDELLELAEAAAKRSLPTNNKTFMRALPRKLNQMSSGTNLMCNYCNYTSGKRYLLTRHMKIHSEERPHKCNICDRGFKTVASLQNHINTHTGVRPHKCKECDSAFTTSGELIRHVRYRHTFEKPHKCPECDYASVELSKLKRHIRSHTGERPYQCPQCPYASPDSYKLKRHLRVHTGEKPYQCDVCQARFTQSNTLNSHKMIHSGTKPIFQCELCPTTCGRKTDLKIHVQKLHTSEKPLICRKCGKAFPDRYTYKIHLKTHDGEKCFKCELCPYAALSQRHLESHILIHTGQKPYQCDDCDQTFRQKQLLKRHVNLYHTPNYVPPVPRERQHECGECHKTFAHRGNLLKHMELHDPDNADNESFKRQLEQQIETDEQRFSTNKQVYIQDGKTAKLVHLPEPLDKKMTEDGAVLQLVTYPNGAPAEILVQLNQPEELLADTQNLIDQSQNIQTMQLAQAIVTESNGIILDTSVPISATTTSVTTSAENSTGQPVKEKRGRGRPKGSVKRTINESENACNQSQKRKIFVKDEETANDKRKDVEECFGFIEEG